jgi:hypothetical protein
MASRGQRRGLAAFLAAAINIVAGYWPNLEVLVYLAAVPPMAIASRSKPWCPSLMSQYCAVENRS